MYVFTFMTFHYYVSLTIFTIVFFHDSDISDTPLVNRACFRHPFIIFTRILPG